MPITESDLILTGKKIGELYGYKIFEADFSGMPVFWCAMDDVSPPRRPSVSRTSVAVVEWILADREPF